jgi:hypothetical protein
MNRLKHLQHDPHDEHFPREPLAPARAVAWRPEPFRLALSSAFASGGVFHDANFAVRQGLWQGLGQAAGGHPFMDLTRVQWEVLVESFVVVGTKNAPADAETSIALLVNLEGLGLQQNGTHDAVHLGPTACAAHVSGNAEVMTLARSWAMPMSGVPGPIVRVSLSEVGAPRTPSAAKLVAATSARQWHAVIVVRPADRSAL